MVGLPRDDRSREQCDEALGELTMQFCGQMRGRMTMTADIIDEELLIVPTEARQRLLRLGVPPSGSATHQRAEAYAAIGQLAAKIASGGEAE
jgi:hypothetical protein